jgi:hypothetical protein
MGKDLHYSILNFLTDRLRGHQKVKSFEIIDDPNFYIYQVDRQVFNDKLFIVLSDQYHFGDYDAITIHPILKNGGFILIARPEANEYNSNDVGNKLGIGKIRKLLGALNKEDFWNYEISEKK